MSLFWDVDENEEQDQQHHPQQQQQQHTPPQQGPITAPLLFGGDGDDEVQFVTQASLVPVKKEKISPAVALVKPKVSAAHRQAGEELLTGFYGKLSKEGKSSAVQELRALSTENLLVKTKNFEETMVHVRSIADSIAKSNAEVTSSRSYQRLGKLVREALELIESLKTLVLEHEEQYRVLRLALLSEVKREWINVPANTRPSKRMANFPMEIGDVKRKRPRAKGESKKNNGKGEEQTTGTGAKKGKKKASAQPKRTTTRSPAAAAVAAERRRKEEKRKGQKRERVDEEEENPRDLDGQEEDDQDEMSE